MDMANFRPDQSFPVAQNPLSGPQSNGFSAPQNPSQGASNTTGAQPSGPTPSYPFSDHEPSDQKPNDVSTTSIPAVAEDSDLIEKEWVRRAKSIVEKTQNNPYLQSQELSALRTEYLRKRYGKTMDSSEQNI